MYIPPPPAYNNTIHNTKWSVDNGYKAFIKWTAIEEIYQFWNRNKFEITAIEHWWNLIFFTISHVMGFAKATILMWNRCFWWYYFVVILCTSVLPIQMTMNVFLLTEIQYCLYLYPRIKQYSHHADRSFWRNNWDNRHFACFCPKLQKQSHCSKKSKTSPWRKTTIQGQCR